MRGYEDNNKESTEMVELKKQLNRDARRHSNKLIDKLSQVIDMPDMAIDSIHQELLYATMDGYRTTMKQTRNGDLKNDKTQAPQDNHGNV